MPSSSAEKRTTYHAHCHCKSIRFTVTLPDALHPQGEYPVLRCTCSICVKNGYLLVYPLREDVAWLDGSEARLKNYYMGKKNKAHRFCPECSSSILIDFQNSDVVEERGELAVSVRTFEGVDLSSLKYKDFDGWNKIDPPYNN